jgi:hypothetical protein
MAINPAGTLPPELFEQQQQLNRQQQMAQMLMQQGTQQPQGQMVSGRYVQPSIFAQLAPLAQLYAGKGLAEKGDKQALDLAKQLRQRYGDELKEFRNLMQGREQLAPEQAGPTQTGQAIPQEMVRGAPNVQGAYDFAATAYNPALQAAGLRKLTEGPETFTLSADQTRFMTMPDGTTKQVAAGTKKPIQIDTGTAIEFRDPDDMSKVLQRISKTQMPTAGQVVERDDGTFLIDTRTGQATPVMGAGGQQLAGKTKGLPEGLNKQVTGSINLSDAITDYQSKIKGFGVQDFANPDKRAEMGNAYNNMMLQAKEAYNLGVLNGPDYEILQKVVRDPTNPSSLLFSNKALDRQAESLRTTAKNIVNTAYVSQGRNVPADIAKKLVKPEVNKPLQSFNTDQDVQQAIQAGTLKKGDKVTVNGVTGTIQ